MLFVIVALLVIVITIIGVAVGRYPWLHMNRATLLVGVIWLSYVF